MKELGITKGEWIVDFDRVPNDICAIAEDIAIVADDWDIAAVFSDITDDGEESKANALLIADAGNTAQKCGLLPSELLQQRDELREALQNLMDGVRGLPPLTAIVGVLEQQYKQAEAAIKNTDG